MQKIYLLFLTLFVSIISIVPQTSLAQNLQEIEIDLALLAETPEEERDASTIMNYLTVQENSGMFDMDTIVTTLIPAREKAEALYKKYKAKKQRTPFEKNVVALFDAEKRRERLSDIMDKVNFIIAAVGIIGLTGFYFYAKRENNALKQKLMQEQRQRQSEHQRKTAALQQRLDALRAQAQQ